MTPDPADYLPPGNRPQRRASRRQFVKLLPAAGAFALASLVPGRALAGPPLRSRRSGDHPEPRPGIDGSRVLTAEQLVNAPHLVDLFDAIREIPHIVDGILCYCGCAHIEGYRSLLACYEDPGMAQHCEVCEGQGRLAHRRWKEGQTLDQIRRATDARFGTATAPAAGTAHGQRGAGRHHHHG